MQTPDFAPGPKFHKEPAVGFRRWEQFIEQQGLFRLANGSFRQHPLATEEKRTEDNEQSRTE